MSAPLTPAHVTRSARVMLPTYAVMFAYLGVNYLLAPQMLLVSNPALAYVDDRLSLRFWGIMFTTAAVMMTCALLYHRRTLYRFALWLCILTMGLFGALITGAALYGNASPTSPSWAVFVVIACIATQRSLLSGEAD